MSTLAQTFFASVDTTFTSFFLTSAARVAAAARTPFNAMVTLYVMLWGLAMWRGLIQEPMADGVMRVVKIVLIGTFALNAGVYGPRIAEALYRTPDQLAAVLIPGTSGTTTAAALDNSIDRLVAVSNKFIEASAAADGIVLPLALVGYSLVLGLFLAMYIAYAFALVLLAKVGLSIVLAVGPIFIALLLFEPTRQLFGSWFNQALNFVFKYVVVAAVLSLGGAFVTGAADSTITAIGAELPSFVDAMRVLMVGGAVLVVLWQSSAIASGLAGGVQIGTMGIIGWAMRSARSAASAPLNAYSSMRDWKDRRLARTYYRQRMGASGGQGNAHGAAWLIGRLRGQNEVRKP